MDDNFYALAQRFADLHSGLDVAFGTGKGQWIKRPPTLEDFVGHLRGEGHGIGIAPLRPDNTVLFAAIDLDEPDFDSAREMQKYIPGTSFVERSRSGNAHIWVFFSEPIEAWVPMGILKEAIMAAGKKNVEVFPKNHDFARVKLGNYINLSNHGGSRRMHQPCDVPHDHMEIPGWEYLTLEMFLDAAEAGLNDPAEWHKKAQWLLLAPPDQREKTAEFGKQPTLHCCAQRIITEGIPVTEGHRSVVYFSLAKQLLNCEMYSKQETIDLLRTVNEGSAPDDIPDGELRRIIDNADRGQFTSTGCDDPLFIPYADPACPVAFPK